MCNILHVHTLVMVMVSCCYDNLLFPYHYNHSYLLNLVRIVFSNRRYPGSVVTCRNNIGENFEIVNVSKITKDLRFIIAEVTILTNASSDQVTSDTDVVIIFMKKRTSCKYYYFIILKMYIYNKSFLKIRCNHFITL